MTKRIHLRFGKILFEPWLFKSSEKTKFERRLRLFRLSMETLIGKKETIFITGRFDSVYFLGMFE